MQMHADGAHGAVIMFFLISGYIISHVGVTETRIEFVIKRFFRIVPTLALAVALTAIVNKLSVLFSVPIADPAQRGRALVDYIESAFLINYPLEVQTLDPPSWSLYSETIFYGLFVLALGTVRKAPIRGTVLLILMMMSILLLSYVIPYVHRQIWVTVYLPMFMIGRVMYLYDRRQIGNVVLLGLTIFYFGILTWFYQFWRPFLLNVSDPAIGTYFYSIVVFYALMRTKIERLPRIIMSLGKMSYAVYILHAGFSQFLMSALDRAGVPLNIIVAIGIMSTFALAYPVAYFFEPAMQRVGRNILARIDTLTARRPIVVQRERTA